MYLNSVDSDCLSTHYSTLLLPCFRIGDCTFDTLVAYKSNLFNETPTEFWINSTDTKDCFSKIVSGGLTTISADLTYDLNTKSCEQKHGSIQLGVSESWVMFPNPKYQRWLLFSMSIPSISKQFNASIKLKILQFPCLIRSTILLKLSSELNKISTAI